MTTASTYNFINKWLPIIFGACLVVSFFLPWVSWKGYLVSGYDLPAGYFFNLSGSKFNFDNPFPQINFSFFIFWLIPAGGVLSIILFFKKKKMNWVVFVTGALSLSIATVFYLFTEKLILLGIGRNIFAMLQPAIWVHVISAIGLILLLNVSLAVLKKTAWILAGPVFVFISFLVMEKHIMNETFSDTAGIKADFSVSASDLILEFTANDSAANKKYIEKIVNVHGATSEVELKSDSTINIKFADSTGSYISFSLEKDQYEIAKNIKSGDAVSLKGSCSGSFYSDILSTTQISFKRSTLNK
jgi:tRNA_anti-like